MSIVELSQRLDDLFTLLTGGSRTALPRHRTLRSLIDWSYELLSEPEKTLLRRCSVFAGGCTVEIVQAVCADDRIDLNAVLELLTSLTDKSLLVAETGGDSTRFRMLETVRHYARDRLRESGEEPTILEQHVDCFVARACALDEFQSDEDRRLKLNRLDPEVDNLRAALVVCEAIGSCSMRGLRLAAHLFWFWRTRGLNREGRGWIGRLLAATSTDVQDDDHAQAHMSAGALAQDQTDLAAAEVHFTASLAIRRRIGSQRKVATLLGNLGSIALARDDNTTARKLIEESLAISREVDDRRQIGWSLQCLGLIYCEEGDYSVAATRLEESISIRSEFGRWNAADAQADLGRVRHALGDNHGARTVLVEALEAERGFGNRHGVARALTWLGMVSHDEGDVAAAKTHIQEAMSIQHAVGELGWLAVTLELFAGVLLDIAGPSHAARLWGCAQRLHEETGSPQGALERARTDRQVAAARAMQDDAAFDRAWEEGRSLALDEVVRMAIDT